MDQGLEKNSPGSEENENHCVGVNTLPFANKSSHCIKAAIVAISPNATNTITLMNINLIYIPPDLN
jgi:hypothetical protein